MACPFRLVGGLESQFKVNHVGHFALFKALLPKLRLAAKDGGFCRVISVASLAHRILKGFSKSDIFKVESINSESKYRPFLAYGRAKLSNVLFALEMERKYGEEGIHAVSLHPGSILTNLPRSVVPGYSRMSSGVKWFLDKVMTTFFGMKSIPQGSATSVYCALAPEVSKNFGGYFEDCNPGKVHQWGRDVELAERLWKLSESLIT